jgi:hypothetical protein
VAILPILFGIALSKPISTSSRHSAGFGTGANAVIAYFHDYIEARTLSFTCFELVTYLSLAGDARKRRCITTTAMTNPDSSYSPAGQQSGGTTFAAVNLKHPSTDEPCYMTHAIHKAQSTAATSTHDCSSQRESASHSDKQTQEESTFDNPSHCRSESPDIQLPPPLYPLTEFNLRAHTQHIGSSGVIDRNHTASELSLMSSVYDSLTQLEKFGVVVDNAENVPIPPVIEEFLRNVVGKERELESPGARNLHVIQPQAANAGSEATVIALIDKHLMIRDESHDLGGERYISLAREMNLPKRYVQKKDVGLELSQPRPDRANGYVPYRTQESSGGQLKSPFTEQEHNIIREIYPSAEAEFPWLTAQFKSAVGESLEIAKWQSARDGVASINHLLDLFDTAGMTVNELQTMHFSLTCNAVMANLFYHWKDRNGRYIMRRLYTANLRGDSWMDDKNKSMVHFRKCIRNLLEDHVLTTRLNDIHDALARIQAQRDKGTSLTATKRGSNTIGASSTGTPNKKKMKTNAGVGQ